MIAVVSESDSKAMPAAKLIHIQAGGFAPVASRRLGRGSWSGGIWQQHIAGSALVTNAIPIGLPRVPV
jgi:hypothetical protein